MKNRYVFVGSLPAHMMGVVSFKAFGQSVELTDDQAREAVLGGNAIAPAAEFAAIGITDKELAKYGPFGAHANLPAEFAAKMKLAIAAYEAFRDRSAAAQVETEEPMKEAV